MITCSLFGTYPGTPSKTSLLRSPGHVNLRQLGRGRQYHRCPHERRRPVADSLRRRRTHASDRSGSGRSHASVAADSAWRQGGAVHLQPIDQCVRWGQRRSRVLGDHRRKTLERGGTFGRYLPGSNGMGHLVYGNKGTLFAVPFDPDNLEVRGTPSPVLEEVAYSALTGSRQFDFSRRSSWRHRAKPPKSRR
jgi:hypothetical protein